MRKTTTLHALHVLHGKKASHQFSKEIPRISRHRIPNPPPPSCRRVAPSCGFVDEQKPEHHQDACRSTKELKGLVGCGWMGRSPFLCLERDFVEPRASAGWVVHEGTRRGAAARHPLLTSPLASRTTESPTHLPLRVGAQRPSCVFVDKQKPEHHRETCRSTKGLKGLVGCGWMGRSPFLCLERDFVEPRASAGWVVHEDTRSHTKRGRCAAPSSDIAPRVSRHRNHDPFPLRVGAQRLRVSSWINKN